MSARRTPLGLLFAAIAVVVVCGTALAYFSTDGTGTATASVGKLTAPNITAATPAAGGKVTLTWSASTAPPGAGTVTYFVQRDGETPGGNCPTAAAPATVVTCADQNVPIGAHEYVVTAIYRTWTTKGAPATATVSVGVATQFSITAATATPVAGVADNLTITAQDEKGSTVTTFTGSHNLVFSGAASSPNPVTPPNVSNSSSTTGVSFGTATALTFTNGVAAVTSGKNGALKIFKAGEANVNATEGSLTDPTPLTLNVQPASAAKYTMTAATSTVTAGGEDALTITAQDAYGNLATGYTGSHNIVFSGASLSANNTAPTVADSSGNEIAFGTATPIVFTAGVATGSGGANGVATLYKVGSTSLKATESSITNATAAVVTVTPANAASLSMAASPTTVAAGGTETLTITALDSYGNTATSYTGTKSLVFSGAAASPLNNAPTITNASSVAIPFGSATTVAFSSGVKAVSAKLYNAAATSVTATDGTFTTNAVAINVTYGAASRIAWVNVTQSAGTGASACFSSCAVTGVGNSGTVSGYLEIVDLYGNVVSNYGAAKTATLTASGGTVTGGSMVLPETGPAVTTTPFTFTYPATGTTTITLTANATSRTAITGTVAK